MSRTYAAIMAGGLVIALGAAPQKDTSAAAQLQAAINKQTVEGDLNGAIKQYASIAAKYAKTDRALAASALVRMAECHQAMGDAEAVKIYERIVRDYADQKEAVAKARASLSNVRTAPGGVSVREVWACSTGGWCPQRVSPDGRYFAFVDNTQHLAGIGDVAVRDLSTGENRLLTHHAPSTETDDIVWSPDGKRLAYDWADYKEIRIINADGSGERTILRVTGDESVWPDDWAPDGRRILISRQTKGDQSMRLEWLSFGGVTEPIKTTVRVQDAYAYVSPDGRYIAFTARQAGDRSQEVHLMASDGTGETTLSAHPAGEYPAGWSLDGGHVIFISLRGNAPGLWAIPVANGKAMGPAHVLKAVLADNTVFPLGITRSGAFYYTSNVFASDIYTASLDPATGKATSAPVLLPLSRTGRNRRPLWSPDGHRLLTTWVEPLAGANAFREMTIFSLDTRKEERLPPFESGRGQCWGPDGTSILAGPPLTRIDLITGAKKPIEGGPDFPTCSARGNLVAYSSAFKVVAVRDLETGSEKELYRVDGRLRVAWSAAISPDGSLVAFTTTEGPAPNAYSASSVMVVSASGGPARELVRAKLPGRVSGFDMLAWSPDSRYVYFVQRLSRYGAGELFRVRATGGEAESSGLKMAGMMDPNVSPDGTRVAFSTANAQDWHVWAFENFLPAAK